MSYYKTKNEEVATIDFESRSVFDLKKGGAWLYSKHHMTEVMVLRYLLPGMDTPGIWHMAHEMHMIDESPAPKDLFNWIKDGGPVEAHNAFFERVMWMNIMVRRYGWPEIKDDQWRCSAAKAAAWSLPRSLEGACQAAGVDVQKDMEGRRLMLKMCKPRKPRKAEVEQMKAGGIDPDSVVLYHADEEDIYRLWDYCGTDVLSEKALSEVVPDLSPEELAIWQADQQFNLRGLLFDVDMAEAALDMAAKEKQRLNKELYTITGIKAASQRAVIKKWLTEHEGLDLPDTAGDTLTHYIENEEMSGRARRICEIVMFANKTSTRKYKAVIDKADSDGRIRDLLMYHGAGTGRWSGKGVQIQNFPGANLIIKDFDAAAEDIKSGDLDWCHAIYGNVMQMLSHALRGVIIAPPGKDLIVADYSAIEARVVLWLADAFKALDVFLRGGDIYCDMASGIYGYQVVKKTHKTERQFGKQAILGLGYGMGFVTFLLTCRKYGIKFALEDVYRIMGEYKAEETIAWVKDYLCMTGEVNKSKLANAKKVVNRLTDAREDAREVLHELALMKYTVGVYRNRYPEVPAMWKAQEASAIRSARGLGDTECGKVMWYYDGEDDVLYCELPSGRRLTYQTPRVKMAKTSWGESKAALSYMSVNGISRKWERTHTYGGKIVENISQGGSRDIMANALLLAEEGSDYAPVLTVHDELGCEVDRNQGTLQDFENLMASVPPWAAGCPIEAEAERYRRYRK